VKLVVIIPALNEEATISSVVERIPDSIHGVDEQQVIVVDDGSTDRTSELAAKAGAVVVTHPENRGVGLAFQTGIDAALRRGADIIVNIDGDGQFDPTDIPALVGPILSGRSDFVTCTRFAKEEWAPDMPRAKKWGNRLLCRVVNYITRAKPGFTDVACGFRAYSRDAALHLNLFGSFTYTQEVMIDLASKQFRMSEVPLQVRGERQYGESRVASSLFTYAREAGLILLRSARDVHPLSFFGGIGLVVFLVGVGLGAFVFAHWVVTGRTSPYRSVLLGSGVALVLSFLLFVLAMLADMLGRVRKSQDRLLYMAKRRLYRPDRENADEGR